ncbi:MAG: hypothetical protein WBU92_08160 [Candidatus Dormiibacterota bacterium]
MRAELVPQEAWQVDPARWLGGLLCQDLRAPDGTLLLPKGHRLERADDVLLEAASRAPLHLIFLGPSDVDEDTAAERLAARVAGRGLTITRPVESQVNCRATARGLLRVDAEALAALNSHQGVTVFTLPDAMPVDRGRAVAGVKITALGIPEGDLAAAEASAGAGPRPLVDVLPFQPLRVGVVVCEGLTPQRRARFEDALRLKVGWLGGSVAGVEYPGERHLVDARSLAGAAAGVDLLLVAGVASTDPLDPPWLALLAAGAEEVRRGLPAHPGSSYWVVRLGGCDVVGVASCGMFSRRTVLDVLLCRRFAGGELDRPFLASLGHGGLLARELAHRFPDYGRDGEAAPEDS